MCHLYMNKGEKINDILENTQYLFKPDNIYNILDVDRK